MPATRIPGRARPVLGVVAIAVIATSVGAQDARTVRGRVVSTEGEPVAEAQVTTESVMLRTDTDGRFTLRVDGCDSVRVAVRRLGFRPASRLLAPCAPTMSDTLVFTLERAAVLLATDSVTAELSGIRGFVETTDGRPVAGAEVTAYHPGRAERGRTVVADYDGGANPHYPGQGDPRKAIT
jgi:hypothetical protein